MDVPVPTPTAVQGAPDVQPDDSRMSFRSYPPRRVIFTLKGDGTFVYPDDVTIEELKKAVEYMTIKLEKCKRGEVSIRP